MAKKLGAEIDHKKAKGNFWGKGHVLKLNCGNGCTAVQMYCKLSNCTLRMSELYM